MRFSVYMYANESIISHLSFMWNLATNEEDSFDADLHADDDFNLNSKGMSSFRKVSEVKPVWLKQLCFLEKRLFKTVA